GYVESQRRRLGERSALESADVRGGTLVEGFRSEEWLGHGEGLPVGTGAAGAAPTGPATVLRTGAAGVFPPARSRRIRRSRSATRGPGSWAKPSVMTASAARIRAPSACSASPRRAA